MACVHIPRDTVPPLPVARRARSHHRAGDSLACVLCTRYAAQLVSVASEFPAALVSSPGSCLTSHSPGRPWTRRTCTGAREARWTRGTTTPMQQRLRTYGSTDPRTAGAG